MQKGRIMKKIAKIAMSSAIAATAITALPGSPIAPQTASAQSCSTIHMVNADGTGSSNINNNPDDEGKFSPTLGSIKYATETTKDIPGLSIDYWNVPYDSAAGAVFSLGSPEQAPVPYGLSRIKGAQIGVDHIKEYHAACPDSKIGVIGYSQGASVAGDIAALLANGAVEGFTKDDFFGAILLADPGRSGKSEKYTGPQNETTAYIPLPKNATYERNGEYSTITDPNTVGWTGQRSLGFKDFSGRVISICHDSDVACSVDPNSVLRPIADISDKNYAPGEHYRHTTSLAATVMENPLTFLNALGGTGHVTDILKSEDIRGEIPALKQQVARSESLSREEKDVVNNALNELNNILTLAHKEDAYGPNIPDNAILAHIIKNGYPTVEKMIPEEFKMIAATLTSAITASAPSIPNDIKQQVDPIIKQLVADYHASYFKDGNEMYTVDGIKAIDWVSQAIATGAKNVANNTLITIAADPQNNGEIELSEPDRKDDGLNAVLNRTLDEQHTAMDNDDTVDSIQIPSDDSNTDTTGYPTGTVEDNSADSTDDSNSEKSNRLSPGSTEGDVLSENEDDDATLNDNNLDDKNDIQDNSDSIEESDKDDTDFNTTNKKGAVKNSSSSNTSSPYEQNTSSSPISYQNVNNAAGSYGPKVDTGGHVKTGFISKIINIIR